MKRFAVTVFLVALAARATPSTTFWAPSNTAIQPFLVPHITYDTYFGGKPGTTTPGSPIYPVTTGLTMGVLPWEDLQLEVGFDMLLPQSDPLVLNAKLGVPEDKLFAWQPSLAFGIFGVGTKKSTDTTLGTDYNMLYAQAQHSIPQVGGYVSVGGYYALQEKLFQSSGGGTARSGFMGGLLSPDINVNLPWLLKINFAADVQTGKNVFGAAGGGVGLYFTDKIALLTGPVYFFDPASQPGGRQWFWTVQLDVDLPLRPAPAATAPAPVAAAPTPAAAPAPADSQPAQAVPAVDKKAEADAAKKP
ncbi:MAG: hypothetical protein ACJ79U_14680 [Myxococcales bacterium]